MAIVYNWLTSRPLTSHENITAKIIISGMNWGVKECEDKTVHTILYILLTCIYCLLLIWIMCTIYMYKSLSILCKCIGWSGALTCNYDNYIVRSPNKGPYTMYFRITSFVHFWVVRCMLHVLMESSFRVVLQNEGCSTVCTVCIHCVTAISGFFPFVSHSTPVTSSWDGPVSGRGQRSSPPLPPRRIWLWPNELHLQKGNIHTQYYCTVYRYMYTVHVYIVHVLFLGYLAMWWLCNGWNQKDFVFSFIRTSSSHVCTCTYGNFFCNIIFMLPLGSWHTCTCKYM